MMVMVGDMVSGVIIYLYIEICLVLMSEYCRYQPLRLMDLFVYITFMNVTGWGCQSGQIPLNM